MDMDDLNDNLFDDMDTLALFEDYDPNNPRNSMTGRFLTNFPIYQKYLYIATIDRWHAFRVERTQEFILHHAYMYHPAHGYQKTSDLALHVFGTQEDLGPFWKFMDSVEKERKKDPEAFDKKYEKEELFKYGTVGRKLD